MTSWLSTVLTRRTWTARHLGAGADGDATRMAAELATMAQDDTLAARGTCTARSQRLARTARRGPLRPAGMADRHHPQLSTR